MENFLRIVEENSVEDEINEARLRFFTTEMKIWDYFNITQQKFSSLNTEERCSLLKKYYCDLKSKYQPSGKIIFVIFLLLSGSLQNIFVVVKAIVIVF